MNFLRYSLRLSKVIIWQTDRQTDTTEIIYHAASRITNDQKSINTNIISKFVVVIYRSLKHRGTNTVKPHISKENITLAGTHQVLYLWNYPGTWIIHQWVIRPKAIRDERIESYIEEDAQPELIVSQYPETH